MNEAEFMVEYYSAKYLALFNLFGQNPNIRKTAGIWLEPAFDAFSVVHIRQLTCCCNSAQHWTPE